jgi:hypothetical protein
MGAHPVNATVHSSGQKKNWPHWRIVAGFSRLWFMASAERFAASRKSQPCPVIFLPLRFFRPLQALFWLSATLGLRILTLLRNANPSMDARNVSLKFWAADFLSLIFSLFNHASYH